jgi:hypothetical protein
MAAVLALTERTRIRIDASRALIHQANQEHSVLETADQNRSQHAWNVRGNRPREATDDLVGLVRTSCHAPTNVPGRCPAAG